MWLEDVWVLRHDAKDTQWLPMVGQANWLAVLRDKKIRTRPAERQALIDGGVGAFIFMQRSNPTKWEYLKLLVRRLEDMEVIFASIPRPFIYGIDRAGALKQIA